MKRETKEKLQAIFIKLAHQIASITSNGLKICVYDDKSCEDVFNEYEKIKSEIKNIIDYDFLADRHKIASFFIYSILKNKPIKLKVNKTDIDAEKLDMLINFNLAMTFATYIITSFYESKYGKELKLISPEVSDGGYNDQLFALIRYIIETDEKILLLAISHILFLIEKYSECKMEKEQ